MGRDYQAFVTGSSNSAIKEDTAVKGSNLNTSEEPSRISTNTTSPASSSDKNSKIELPSGSGPDKSQMKESKERKSLKELAEQNPTQLGDPVSLKAETSDHEPTDQDRGASDKKLGRFQDPGGKSKL